MILLSEKKVKETRTGIGDAAPHPGSDDGNRNRIGGDDLPPCNRCSHSPASIVPVVSCSLRYESAPATSCERKGRLLVGTWVNPAVLPLDSPPQRTPAKGTRPALRTGMAAVQRDW